MNLPKEEKQKKMKNDNDNGISLQLRLDAFSDNFIIKVRVLIY